MLQVRANLLQERGLTADAFLPVALQKQGQKNLRAIWENSDEGHALGSFFKALASTQGLQGICSTESPGDEVLAS